MIRNDTDPKRSYEDLQIKNSEDARERARSRMPEHPQDRHSIGDSAEYREAEYQKPKRPRTINKYDREF
jgi:hypothetical protein